jgi:hypothetical protein
MKIRKSLFWVISEKVQDLVGEENRGKYSMNDVGNVGGIFGWSLKTSFEIFAWYFWWRIWWKIWSQSKEMQIKFSESSKGSLIYIGLAATLIWKEYLLLTVASLWQIIDKSSRVFASSICGVVHSVLLVSLHSIHEQVMGPTGFFCRCLNRGVFRQ